MITSGIFGGLALLFIGIAVLVLISSLIRLAGPILIIAGAYYLYKTYKARKEQGAEAAEEPIVVHFEESKPKDAAEILAEKYEGK